MRFSGLFVSLLILSACNSTQTVYVQTMATQTSNTQQASEVAIQVTRKGQSPKSVTEPVRTPVDEGAGSKPQFGSVSVNPKDLASVTQHCEIRAKKTVYMTLNCKTTDEKNICNKSKQGEKSYLSEVKHCLSQFGWNAY